MEIAMQTLHDFMLGVVLKIDKSHYSMTVNIPIIPLLRCSAMWQ